jgi:hypothetical protein
MNMIEFPVIQGHIGPDPGHTDIKANRFVLE